MPTPRTGADHPPTIQRIGSRYRFYATFDSEDEAKEARQQLFGAKTAEPNYTITGVTAEEFPDFTDVYERAVREFKKKDTLAAKKSNQRIDFVPSKVCGIFAADQHLQSPGCDVERAFREADIAAAIPNSFRVTVGDVFDNYIVLKLQHLNFNNRLAITDGLVLTQEYFERYSPQVIVGGNHDNDWTQNATGIDWMRAMVADIVPNAIYDTDDCRLTVSVAGVEFPTRIRHKWRGNSIYNPTHGIERAQKWDQDFILGVGAHTHQCGVARQFNAGGKHGLAVLCGSYKIHDSFAVEIGVPKPNWSTAMAVLFDAETQSMTGFDNLEAARDYMEKVS